MPHPQLAALAPQPSAGISERGDAFRDRPAARVASIDFPRRSGQRKAAITTLAGVIVAAGLTTLATSTVQAQESNPLAATVDRDKSAPTTGEAGSDPAVSPQAAPVSSASAPAPSENRDDDKDVLEQLPELSTNYLTDLLGLYRRLGNNTMADAVAGELNRRDPSGAAALEAVSNDAAMALEGDDGAFGDDSDPGSPFDSVGDHADQLILMGRAAEAVALLEEAKKGIGSGGNFPLELTLANAYFSAGRKVEALASFQLVADSSAFPAADRAEAARDIAAIRRADEIAETHIMLEKGQARAGLDRATQLAASDPAEPEGQLLLARALTANGRHAEALALFETQRQRSPAGAPFEGQADYADALYNNGKLADARAAYEVVVADASQLPTLRYEARRTAREIRFKTAANTSTDFEYLHEAEGERAFVEFDASAEVRPGLRVGAHAWHDNVSLSDERSLRRDSGSTTGAYAFARQEIAGPHFIDVRAGGADHGKVIYGVAAGRQAANELRWGWQAAFQGNHSAIDSLQLIALDGRENVTSVDAEGPLPLGLKLRTRVGGRTVYAGDTELGDGWFGEVEIGRTVWKDKANLRSLWLAYQGVHDEFDARNLNAREVNSLGLIDPAGGAAFSGDLLEDLYQPQGFTLTFDHQINDRLSAYVGTGINYDFADDEIDWHLTAGMSFLVIEDLELTCDAGYYSDGTAANASSEVIVANLGLRYFY